MFNVKELEANEYVFLTLMAGTTLQKGDKVKAKSDLIERTIRELGDRVTQVGIETSVSKLKFATFEITRV